MVYSRILFASHRKKGVRDVTTCFPDIINITYTHEVAGDAFAAKGHAGVYKVIKNVYYRLVSL